MSQKRKEKKTKQHSCPAEREGREGWRDVWNPNTGCVMFYFTRINGDEICMKQLEAATEIESEAEQKRPQNLWCRAGIASCSSLLIYFMSGMTNKEREKKENLLSKFYQNKRYLRRREPEHIVLRGIPPAGALTGADRRHRSQRRLRSFPV